MQTLHCCHKSLTREIHKWRILTDLLHLTLHSGQTVVWCDVGVAGRPRKPAGWNREQSRRVARMKTELESLVVSRFLTYWTNRSLPRHTVLPSFNLLRLFPWCSAAHCSSRVLFVYTISLWSSSFLRACVCACVWATYCTKPSPALHPTVRTVVNTQHHSASKFLSWKM